jgi:hypothetical protein
MMAFSLWAEACNIKSTQHTKWIQLLLTALTLSHRWLRWSSGLRAGLWFPSSPKPLDFLCQKSSARLPSEGKLNNLSHVSTLRHVKEPLSRGVLRADSEIPSTFPSFSSRGLSRRLVRWRLWRWMRKLLLGVGHNKLNNSFSVEDPAKRPLTFNRYPLTFYISLVL